MGLLDMCCPKKPKKSLDYVIKWMENADKTFNNINASITEINAAISAIQGDIKDLEDWKTTIESSIDDLVAEAIEDYDWSNLPVEALQAKADKVENVVVGHLAALDSNGNLVDSGSGIDEDIEEGNLDLATCNAVYTALQGKANKVNSAVDGNFASLDENGNPQDSGYKPADFAESDHEHNYIADFSGYEHSGARVMVGEGDQGAGVISLIVKGNGSGSDSKTAEIDYYGIDNLNRALTTPSSTPENNANKLITSKAVYDALAGKADSIKTLNLSHDTYNNQFYPTSSDSELISAFMDDVPENQLVPVVVKLFEGLHEDGEVIGVAKWYTSEYQQEELVNVEVTIGNILFRATDTDVSSMDEWVRTSVGQSFFTISNS